MNVRNISCRLPALIAFLSLITLIPAANADDYEHSRFTVDSGSPVVSKGGNFELTGTFGQQEVGSLSGGDFTLAGGFLFNITGAADLDFDYDVDFMDFAILGNQWFQPPSIPSADIVPERGDGVVDLLDLGLMCELWLKGVQEYEYECFYDISLDSDPGWTTQGQWAFGVPAGGGGSSYGNPDPDSGYTGTNVYGVNLSGDYSTIVGGPYCLTAGPFGCRGYSDIHIEFARWLNTDIPPYVVTKIEASNNGTSWSVIWEHTGTTALTDDDWQIVEYDISSIADNQDTVYIHWSYQILDDRAYPYSGWNIDDIQLWGTQL